MIINSYVFSSLDPDAQAFITAAGITDATQKTAINQLVINTKAAGIWTKMKAIYPFVGGTATTHKWNLKNPADTDAAFRLIFSGGWTHTSNGAQPNGTNGYADTRLNMSSNYSVNDNAHISFYSRTATNSGVPNYDMGTYDNVHYSGAIAARSSISYYAINFNNSQSYLTPADTNGAALYVSNRIGATVSGWRNNTKSIQSTLPTTGRPNTTMYLGNLNVNGAPNAGLWSFRQYAFASIGDGLTDTEVLVFNQIVEGYQYALGRNVNPVNTNYYNTAYNNETNAFLYASEITDNTQKSAINTLVNNFKTAGIWTKMKAIYPMVGGSATTHKWNLKDPQDTNAAYRLTFSGGWTHTSTGAKPNGTNAKADTFLTPSGTLSQNSSHLSYYSRTQSNGTEVEIGSSTGVNASDNKIIVEIRTSGVSYYNINSTSTYITHLDSDSRAFYVGNRTDSNVVNGWRNGLKLATGTVLSTPPSTRTINIGCFNSQPAGAFFSTKECAFASIGDGLTDTEVLVFNQIVEGYQYALGRNVNPVNTNYYNTAYNNETNAFLYASQITDNTQKNAVNTLVNDLKIAGIWTKTKAAYPMIGGTSSTHKWNLVNPQDTDAAFRLTFNGGWTHSSTGATPNGTNAFANTFLVPSSTITLNSMSLSYYSRTNTTPANNSINMGSWVGAGFHYTLLSIRSILSSTTTYGMLQTSGTFAQFLDPNSLGLYTVTRTANNLTKIFKNGILNATNSELSTANSSNSIYLGAANGNTLNYSNRECAFALITDGLTDAEAGNLYTAIQNFNTTLSRQV